MHSPQAVQRAGSSSGLCLAAFDPDGPDGLRAGEDHSHM